MKTCYLHVGHAKTATSSIQSFMHINRDLFEAAGVWIPGDYRPFKALNCHAAVNAGGNFAGNLAPVFNAKVSGNTALTDALLEFIFSGDLDVLLSTEMIFYYKFLVRDIIRLANKRGFAVTVLAYLRRQDRAVVPAYYQNIRNHNYFKSLPSFIEDTSAARYFRYAEVLTSYEVTAPNSMLVRTFEPEFLKDCDIIEDFLSTLNLSRLTGEAKRPNARLNQSLPLESLEIMRGLNALGRSDLVQKIINQPLAEGYAGESRRVNQYFYTYEVMEIVSELLMERNAELVSNFIDPRLDAERAYWLQPPDLPSEPVQLDSAKLAKTLSAFAPQPIHLTSSSTTTARPATAKTTI